jgi:hypothetical protein
MRKKQEEFKVKKNVYLGVQSEYSKQQAKIAEEKTDEIK